MYCNSSSSSTNFKKFRIFKITKFNFGGFAKEKDWRENYQQLKQSLDRDGKGYVKNKYVTAGHDPPFRLFGRHNEVLVLADPQPSAEGKKQGEE